MSERTDWTNTGSPICPRCGYPDTAGEPSERGRALDEAIAACESARMEGPWGAHLAFQNCINAIRRLPRAAAAGAAPASPAVREAAAKLRRMADAMEAGGNPNGGMTYVDATHHASRLRSIAAALGAASDARERVTAVLTSGAWRGDLLISTDNREEIVDEVLAAAGGAPPADREAAIQEVMAAIPATFWGSGTPWADGTDPYREGGEIALRGVRSILERLLEMPDSQRMALRGGAAPASPAVREAALDDCAALSLAAHLIPDDGRRADFRATIQRIRAALGEVRHDV